MTKTLIALLALFLLSFSTITESKVSPLAPKSKSLAVENVSKGKLTRLNFEDSIQHLYDHIKLKKSGLDFKAFRLGMIGFHNLKNQNKLSTRNILSIIDFNKPSTEKRFYTIDLNNRRLLFHSLVAHGRNTGENFAKAFSNVPHSNQSSLGFYVTGETYVGSKGYSLKLDGVEKSFNGNLRKRAVVIHSANYVSEYWIKKYGRLGRSQGCPALPKEISKKVIDIIKNKTVVFGYFNDEKYLNTSAFVDFETLMTSLEAKTELATVLQ